MNQRASLLGSSLALAFITPGLFLQASAQTATGDATVLAPVRVTGTAEKQYDAREASQVKFTAPLIDTPKSVQVIPEAVIQDSAAASLQDVLRNSPGITFGAGEGGQPLADRPFIRGASSGNNVYVDGVRDPGGQTREIFNLERVEVIKGADSAIGGRGSGGGSINLVSKRARLGNFAEGSFGYGTDGYARATADGNWQFGDHAALRLNVLGAKGNTPGRNVVDYDKVGVAPTLTLGLGTPTRVTFSYYHLNTNGMPDYGVPLAGKFPQYDNGSGIFNVGRDTFYGVLDRDYQTTQADIGTIEIEHDLSDSLTLRNATRYGVTVNEYVVTNPGDSVNNNNYIKLDPVTNEYWIQRRTKSRWQQSRLLSNVTELYGDGQTGSFKHRYTVGMELTRETNQNANLRVNTTGGSNCPAVFGAGQYDCTSLLSPNPDDPWHGTITRDPLNQDITSTTKAIYALDTIDLTDRILLNLGVRVDNYDVSGKYVPRGQSTAVNAENQWTMVNYQVGGVYKLTPNSSVYLSYATASTPPTVSGGDQEGLSADTDNYKPEQSATWELGTKWSLLDKKLDLTAALFQTERRDQRIEVENNVYAQAGKTRVRGFELGFAGALTSRWNVYGGYTYMDSELLQGAYDSVNEGDPLANTPEHSFSLWTTYKVSEPFTIGGGAYYVGKTFGGNQGGAGGGTNKVYMPAYWRFDAMAAYQVNKNLSLQLNVMNLTDEVYFARTNGVHHADFGPGRQIMLTAGLKY